MPAGNGPAPSTRPEGNGPTAHRSRVLNRGNVAKYDLDHGAQVTEPCSWTEIDAALIADVVASVTRIGDAIMFSLTSDHGAFSVTLMSGGKSVKQWPSDAEGCSALLTKIMVAADSV